MLYILIGFVFGLFVPYMARRFAKFMPATFAGAVIELFRGEKKSSQIRKNHLYKKLLWRSLVCGFITASLIAGILFHFNETLVLPLTVYCLILVLLAEIDFRSRFLPDILTIPLLILGFLLPCCHLGLITYCESAFGATVGYFLPVLATLLIAWYKKDAFGGGDIKLLSAIGAWLGIEGLFYVIACSSILGLAYALISRKKELAFGPMIALSGIIVAFCLF